MKKVKDTVIYHSNKLNKEKHIITQVDAKIIWQNPISIMIFKKSHRKLEIERNILNINMDSYGKPISSVAQSCPTLCNPMNCSMPGLPVHHQLPEFTQTHVH